MSPNKKKATAGPSQEAGPLLFYMPDAKYGEFCQWYPSRFTVTKAQISKLVGRTVDEADSYGDITFTCVEQFMMYCKAGRFGDTARQARILATSSPKEQKQLGKGTEGSAADSWDEIKSAVVEAGNIAKFGQDLGMRRKLLATGERMPCEAATRDRVWWIGYSMKHAMAHDRH
ncbi:hypothetical protein B0J13DRAFT_4908 [Dactylonectria estremocensis]|uniref:NADAR domain-containing protein n=1 Tax=Dactylonectria estremocensis TaxID=1079267 RepID=A0A9P9JI10_9HYPO|nr:hypothetical protein B0J13DRAFT_4908 [Dactylonectria estremocensis]